MPLYYKGELMKKKENRLKDLEKEVEQLRIENKLLKELIPDKDCANPQGELYLRLQKALAEAIALRDEYNAAYQSVILLGVKREKEFNDLMAQLKTSIEESKAMRNGFR